MKFELLGILAAISLTGCAGTWPNLPSTTYAGTVLNNESGEPAPNVKITATRFSVTPGLLPGQPFVPMDPSVELMAETRSGKDGKFVLTTPSGYAQRIEARSNDGMTATVNHDLKLGRNDLVLKIQ